MRMGAGSGAPCDACGGRIRLAQIEYDWIYPNRSRVFRMHFGCAGLWEALLKKRGPNPAS